MLPKDIKSIVNSTLKRMGGYSPEMETLICGTFAVESGIDSLFSPGPFGPNEKLSRKHGLMMMKRDVISYLVEDWLPFRHSIRTNITAATGIDILNFTVDEIAYFAESNIALMVALTYCAFQSSFEDIPENTLEAIGACYVSHYNKHLGNVTVADFIELYKEIF